MSSENPYDDIQQARTCFERGDFQGAIAYLEEAIASAHAQGRDDIELNALANLSAAWGNLANHQKEVETATRLLARARTLQREEFEMRATLRLAEALAALDLRSRWHELKPLLLEGLTMAQRRGDSYFELYHLMKLGEFAVTMHEHDDGATWLQDALNLLRFDTPQHAWFRCQINAALAHLMQQRGNAPEAVRYAEIAVGSASDYGNPMFLADARLTLAKAEQARGNPAEAERLIAALLPQAHQMQWRNLEQQAEYHHSLALYALGKAAEAQHAARHALDLADELKAKEAGVLCRISLGRALLALKQHDQAREVLGQARRLAQERNYPDHFSTIEQLMRQC